MEMTYLRYRAWLKPTEKMHHVVGIEFLQNMFIKADKNADIVRLIILEGDYHDIKVMPKYVELMMYSPLPDIDGELICESDIIEIQLEGGVFRSEVFYICGCFWFKDWNADRLADQLLPLCDYASDCKIVGDVYRNENLLIEKYW